ncbi:hypothetical protein KR51_00025790 [Rubidibacter lacunae KORDI 51-2]|uniref:Uncharacterized protein n=1 Tax=Rubidibacter lacunae KORDI 51-2 TaxID=582515 RepID=U5D8C3_9CHRO|nr:hypothetical protein [Rubidibacter lacunae]ERN40868.1 hypothetical protein KR51_00025790 [Rubidibacter lacunae KORDI 51-2]
MAFAIKLPANRAIAASLDRTDWAHIAVTTDENIERQPSNDSDTAPNGLDWSDVEDFEGTGHGTDATE